MIDKESTMSEMDMKPMIQLSFTHYIRWDETSTTSEMGMKAVI